MFQNILTHHNHLGNFSVCFYLSELSRGGEPLIDGDQFNGSEIELWRREIIQERENFQM